MAGRRVFVFQGNEQVLDVRNKEQDVLSMLGRLDRSVDLAEVVSGVMRMWKI